MINRPKNSKALLSIIAVLLLANIAGVVFFIMNNPTHQKSNPSAERKNAMKAYLKNDIGFSAPQMVVYDSLSEQHHRNMEPMFDQLKKEKENRLKYISQFEYADTAIATAVSKTALLQQRVETKMLIHLKDIRNICTEDQQIKFDTSIYKMFLRKGGGDKKKQN